MNETESRRIAILRFPLIVGVVFIHDYDTRVAIAGVTIGSTGTVMTDFVRNLISQGLARIAVPLFFLMSGYLLFKGFSRLTFRRKIASRASTLLIPFLFWNIASLLFFAALQSYGPTSQYFSGRQPTIATFTVTDFIRAIFGIGRTPIAYQFWFIRDLMLLVLASPLVFVAVRSIPITSLLAITCSWITDGWPLFAPSSQAMLFYILGAALTVNHKSMFILDRVGLLATITYIPLAIICALLYDPENSRVILLNKVTIAVGIVAILFSIKYIIQLKAAKHIIDLGTSSFFVFATHEPILTISRKLAYKLLHPDNPYQTLALYIALPILVISMIVLIHRALMRLVPRFTALIDGGAR